MLTTSIIAKNPYRFYNTSSFNPKQFQLQLKQINPNPVKLLNERYLVSNESGWHEVLRKLQSYPLPNNPMRSCAFLIGDSHWPSALPLILKFAKIIVFNDVDTDVHDHIRLTLELIKKVNHKSGFIEQYYHLSRERLLDDLSPDPYHYQRNLKIIESALLEYYFLSSQERYLVSQRAVREAKIFYSHCNLFNKLHLTKFNDILYKHDIRLTLMNLSNVQYYDEDNQLANSLESLAKHQSIILHSKYVDPKNGVVALEPVFYKDFIKTHASRNSF